MCLLGTILLILTFWSIAELKTDLIIRQFDKRLLQSAKTLAENKRRLLKHMPRAAQPCLADIRFCKAFGKVYSRHWKGLWKATRQGPRSAWRSFCCSGGQLMWRLINSHPSWGANIWAPLPWLPPRETIHARRKLHPVEEGIPWTLSMWTNYPGWEISGVLENIVSSISIFQSYFWILLTGMKFYKLLKGTPPWPWAQGWVGIENGWIDGKRETATC